MLKLPGVSIRRHTFKGCLRRLPPPTCTSFHHAYKFKAFLDIHPLFRFDSLLEYLTEVRKTLYLCLLIISKGSTQEQPNRRSMETYGEGGGHTSMSSLAGHPLSTLPVLQSRSSLNIIILVFITQSLAHPSPFPARWAGVGCG